MHDIQGNPASFRLVTIGAPTIYAGIHRAGGQIADPFPDTGQQTGEQSMVAVEAFDAAKSHRIPVQSRKDAEQNRFLEQRMEIAPGDIAGQRRYRLGVA